MCRADLRREERREERRRRRADPSASSAGAATASTSIGSGSGSGSTQSTLSSRGTITSIGSSASLSSRRVPDLVGGGGYHSRNASVASSRTSFSSVGGLSRATSNASTTSRRGFGGVHVDSVIMEDDDEEEEWLASDSNSYPLPLPPASGPKYRVQQYPQPHQRRRPSVSKLHGKKKLEPFGMGQDMRDVLEEIISMEKEFVIDDPGMGMNALVSGENGNHAIAAPAGVFTAVFDRPPRTPSPGMEGKRQSVVPGAPLRGHRKSMSVSMSTANHQLAPSRFMNNDNNGANVNAGANRSRPRPPSMLGHSASLSESHTALYLATASPESGRRSASPPRLKARNSMTFTPEAAGPVIPNFLGHFTPTTSAGSGGNGNGMGMLSTPSRRRPQHSPTAHHPVMSGWRFPNSNTATPTKLTIDTRNLEIKTPTKQQQQQRQRHRGPALGLDSAHLDAASLPLSIPHPHPQPHLLWPAPPALAPSLFPSSPGGMNGTPNSGSGFEDPATRFRQQVNTSPSASASAASHPHPRAHAHVHAHGHGRISPPTSGLRLGYLLGSGDDIDIDIEMDVDGQSSPQPYHGFGFGARLPGAGGGGGMPVYLHPEGFRPNF